MKCVTRERPVMDRLDLVQQSPRLHATSRDLWEVTPDDQEVLRRVSVPYDALYSWTTGCKEEAHGSPAELDERQKDTIEEASEESFPASNPSSFTPLSKDGVPR